MIIKARGTVTLPKRPHGIGDFLRFSRDVVTCLQQLRDRCWAVPLGGKGVTASEGCNAFLLAVSDDDKYTVSESTVGGLTPSGFTDGLQEFTVTIDDGVVYTVLVIDASGNPVSATVEQGASLPSDTATELHRQIGTFHVEDPEDTAVLSVTQTRCGPFDAVICRNWFAAEAPFFGVTWS